MKKFFKDWLGRQLRYFFTAYVPVIFIIIFGMLVVSYWPDYAWGSTVIFAIAVLAVTFWLV